LSHYNSFVCKEMYNAHRRHYCGAISGDELSWGQFALTSRYERDQ